MRGKFSIMATDDKGKPMEVHTLRCGDAFGYSDLLKVTGPEYLGEMKVSLGCNDSECMVIEDPEMVIQLYERKILRDLVAEDYTTI